MSAGMPELGSKISLISKADIRYEGRLFTVDPQECTIALANGKFQMLHSVASWKLPTPCSSVALLCSPSKGSSSHSSVHIYLLETKRVEWRHGRRVWKKRFPLFGESSSNSGKKRKERKVKWSVSHTHVNLHHRSFWSFDDAVCL